MRTPRLPPFALALAAALLLPACGATGGRASSTSSGALDPAAPMPKDFRLEVRAEGGLNPHCDYRLALAADGSLEYDVHHRAPRAANRRGKTTLARDRVETVWRWAARSGIDALPSRMGPQEGQGERGVVVFDFRGAGRTARVESDRAADAGLDGILAALFWAVPVEIFATPK